MLFVDVIPPVNGNAGACNLALQGNFLGGTVAFIGNIIYIFYFLDEVRLNPTGRARAANNNANLYINLETTPAISSTDLRAVLPSTLKLVAASFPNVVLDQINGNPLSFQLTTAAMGILDAQPVSQMRRNIDFDLVQWDSNNAEMVRLTISRPFIIYGT